LLLQSNNIPSDDLSIDKWLGSKPLSQSKRKDPLIPKYWWLL